ncbi:hypothetical protein [Streptomyces sp. NPDC057686]|uniref:hypothetical protein n=1 Tax=Streptomyces sp. NPDC057686 TaxID=3346212 RepID=UPI0036CA028E
MTLVTGDRILVSTDPAGRTAATEHFAQQGSFGDVGGLVLKRGGEQIGDSRYPSGVFEVPAEEATYELTQQTEKFGRPARTWQRSRAVATTRTFVSKQDPAQYSQSIPILFPSLSIPGDGMKTLPAADGQTTALAVTGHAGCVPGALTSVTVSYSYDGEHRTQAQVSERGGRWSAVVNHAGAGAGRQVTLKVELTDANGAAVTQTVARAYDIRQVVREIRKGVHRAAARWTPFRVFGVFCRSGGPRMGP